MTPMNAADERRILDDHHTTVLFWRRRPIWRPTGWRWGLSCKQPLHSLQRPDLIAQIAAELD